MRDHCDRHELLLSLFVTTTKRRRERQEWSPDLAVLVEKGEDRTVPRGDVRESAFREAGEELGLEREEKAHRENTEIRVPLLPFATSFGGGHYLR